MSGSPLRLGPDPNRTYLERWNQMHPDQYGAPDLSVDAEDGWPRGQDRDTGGYSQNSSSVLLSLAILVLAPIAGAIATLQIYRWTVPSQLTTGWILGYAALYLATVWISAMLVYALRRLLLAATIAGVTSVLGYVAWRLWFI